MRKTQNEEIVLLHESLFSTPIEPDFVLRNNISIIGIEDYLEIGAVANVESVFQVAKMRVLHNNNLASLHFNDMCNCRQVLVVSDEYDRATDTTETEEGYG